MVGHLEETSIMTQEEKQLLLKDLCARFPYGVMCRLSAKDTDVSITEKLELGGLEHFISGTMGVLPYLRPMSSATEEEKKEFIKFRWTTQEGEPRMYEWCDYANAHHFDYRGLISMGLALEAQEGMYKTE